MIPLISGTVSGVSFGQAIAIAISLTGIALSIGTLAFVYFWDDGSRT